MDASAASDTSVIGLLQESNMKSIRKINDKLLTRLSKNIHGRC